MHNKLLMKQNYKEEIFQMLFSNQKTLKYLFLTQFWAFMTPFLANKDDK